MGGWEAVGRLNDDEFLVNVSRFCLDCGEMDGIAGDGMV